MDYHKHSATGNRPSAHVLSRIYNWHIPSYFYSDGHRSVCWFRDEYQCHGENELVHIHQLLPLDEPRTSTMIVDYNSVASSSASSAPTRGTLVSLNCTNVSLMITSTQNIARYVNQYVAK